MGWLHAPPWHTPNPPFAMGPSRLIRVRGLACYPVDFFIKTYVNYPAVGTGYAHLWEINTRTSGPSSDFGWLALPCGDNHESPHHRRIFRPVISATTYGPWTRSAPPKITSSARRWKSWRRRCYQRPVGWRCRHGTSVMRFFEFFWGMEDADAQFFLPTIRSLWNIVLVSDSRYEVNGGPKLWTVELRGTRIAPNWQVDGARHGRHLWDFWPGGWFHTACTHTNIHPSVRPSIHACMMHPMWPCTRAPMHTYTHIDR